MSCEQIKASTKQISRIPKVSEKHRGDAADMKKTDQATLRCTMRAPLKF